MSRDEREFIVSTKAAADSTLGACGLAAIVAVGSAAASTITVLDGTAIKFVRSVATTAQDDFVLGVPMAFQNLIIDLTGTAGYSVVYRPH